MKLLKTPRFSVHMDRSMTKRIHLTFSRSQSSHGLSPAPLREPVSCLVGKIKNLENNNPSFRSVPCILHDCAIFQGIQAKLEKISRLVRGQFGARVPSNNPPHSPNRRKVLECGGCDTAFESRMTPDGSLHLEMRTPFESGVALCLPPHSRTQARNGRLIPQSATCPP